MFIRSIVRCAGLVVVGLASTAEAQTYDLRADWSDSVNPNGAWSYREGVNALPKVAGWQPASWGTPQPAWARGTGSPSFFVPAWMKSNGSETFVHDWQAGDVVVHTTDVGSGGGQGPANVAWTSPVDGIMTVSGAVWAGREISRPQHWTLTHGSAVLAEGDLSTGDPYSRSSPFTFASGALVPSALIDRLVAKGDVLMMEALRTGFSGDFIGVNFTVSVCIGLFEQPVSMGTCPSGMLELRAVGAGPGEITYQWKRETSPGVFVDVVNGSTGTGSVISGAKTGTLTIVPAVGGSLSDADEGSYRCHVASSCGSMPSVAATLHVTCEADLNCDGLVDFVDYLAFLNFYDGQDLTVDFNRDGLVDFGDYLEFLNMYDSGC